MLQVTFAEMTRVLEGLGSSVRAAEAHGCLVGALCTTLDYPLERWLEEIIPDEEARNGQAEQALRLLYSDTLNALRGGDMEFQVLLPGDDTSLAVRAGGLSQWCQGFLYGFGTGSGNVKRDKLPGNVNEILNDLTHIGRATVEIEGEGDDSEEAAYVEVVEYVRVGVQLIHDELIPAKARRIDMSAVEQDAGRDADESDRDIDTDEDDDADTGRDPTLH
jgi:uncharacterized protein YgfB (UPF0149 family)